MSEVIADEFEENSVVPCVLTFYSNEKSVKERFRTRIPICFKKHTTLNGFKQHLIDFAGIKEHAASIGVGSYELKLYRLDTKTNTNYIIQTQSQWDLERPLLVDSPSEINVHVIQKIVNWSGNTIVLVEGFEALPVSTNRKLKTNKPFRKRRSKHEEAEYNDLVKKIKIGENFERTERQKEDFETFCKELKNLSESVPTDEIHMRCGVCSNVFVVNEARSTAGKIDFFKKNHYNKCVTKKEKYLKDVEKSKKITDFFTKPIVADAFDNNDVLNENEKEEMLEEDPYAAIVDPSNYDNKIVDNNLYDIGKEDDVHDQLEHPIQELTSDERQVISDVSMDGSCCSGDDSSVCSEEEYKDLLMPQVFEDAHPLAKKLQDCITEGKLTEESFMYKYLTDVCTFAMKNGSESFQWDPEVIEFFNTVKYLGGQKSFNFVRGPGFLGSGRGGIKHVNTLSDFNLCGPSTNALRKCQAGFSTQSGVYSSLMNAFYQNALLEKALVSPLFSSDTVHIIPCCLAADGTALKPGLEYDNTHHYVVGLTDSMNADYIKANPIANNLHLKSQMVTEADVSFLTSLDNGASMPIGVHYLPKSFSGEQMKDMFIETALSVQICASCLVDCIKTNISIVNKNIVQDVCISHCQSCWDTQEVCEQGIRLGHVSYYPALRSCSKCTDKGIKCVKVAVFSLVTDCEEHNKKVMESFDEVKLQNPSLNQAVMIPDCVHVGKSLKCSWSNWFIIVENCRTNLVFMRTLRDHGDAHLKAELCKLLSLECVRNKDRMAVDPILRLTAAKINELLNNVEYVIHTVVPETYKYWKSNLPNTYAHPVGICTGPSGFLLAIDILDEETACGRLLEIRLHYPADVKLLQILDGPLTGDLCYLNGVVYICGNRPGKFLYYDIQHKVKLQVSKIRSKRELEDNLEIRHRSTIGTMPILRARLDNHLKQIVKKHPKINHILLNRNIVPTAICGESDFLFCFDDITKCLFQINLSFDGIGVNGNAILLHQMDDVQCVNGIIKSNTKLFCTTKGVECGIVAFDLESGAQQTIIAKQGLNGLGLLGESIVVGDEVNHSVSVFNTESNTLKPIAGNGTKGYKDGTNTSSHFSQPFGICTEGNSVFVTDPACGRIAVVSDLFGTRMFLKSLGFLYRAFGIHEKGNKYPKIDLKSTVERVYDAKSFVQEHVQNAKNVQQLQVNVTNGPQGTVSNKTCRSIQILHSGISELTRNVHVLSSGQYRTEASTLLTSIVENLHAVSHLRHQTFSMLEYARDFSTIIRESLKRVSVWSVKYFTHPNSYYPVPNSNMPLSDVFNIKFDLEIKKVSKTDEVAMKSWIENYRPIRQRSVRDETTKDKASTLPISLYRNQDFQNRGHIEFRINNEVRGGVTEETINTQNENLVDEILVDSHSDNSDEYDSSSSSDDTQEQTENENIGHISRSGRVIRATVRLDL